MKVIFCCALIVCFTTTHAATAPSGNYAGSVKKLGETVSFKGNAHDDGKSFDLDIHASGLSKVDISCQAEQYELSEDGTVTLPNSGTAGNCIHDALKKYAVTIKSIKYDSGKDAVTLAVHKIIDLTIVAKHTSGALLAAGDVKKCTPAPGYQTYSKYCGSLVSFETSKEWCGDSDEFKARFTDGSGCSCADGFVYNSESKRCVPFGNCQGGDTAAYDCGFWYDPSAYCGSSTDIKARFTDGSGCSCGWGKKYDAKAPSGCVSESAFRRSTRYPLAKAQELYEAIVALVSHSNSMNLNNATPSLRGNGFRLRSRTGQEVVLE